jgi:hypothetical protein
MTEHSIYSIKTAATPAFMPPPSSTMPDFCPFACDLSKLEPQLAIRIELLTAARMRETARAECSRAGMVQMLADGEVTVRKGDNHRAATYHRGEGKTSRPPVTINGVEYPSQAAAARALGISESRVSQIKGRFK